MSGAPAVFELDNITKPYGGLRPLRLRSLIVRPNAMIALTGLDAPAAEMLVNLLTGAALPEAGEVRVFGRATSAITNADEWLASIDRFGIVSDRAVLLDELTVAQNLAMTLTLDIDPISQEIRARVEQVASDVSLAAALLDRKVVTLPAVEKLRVRLGRAIALGPSVLLLEHATATLSREAAAGVANEIARLARARELTVVALTSDSAFASALTTEAWTLVPADGSLVPLERGAWGKVRKLFGG